MLKDFKEFILTKNVVELAIAVILAGAVGLVVTGFVNDIMMPIVGNFTGGVDFSDLKFVLSEATTNAKGEAVPENAIRYGSWINALINLVIVGGVLFMINKSYKKFQKKKAEDPVSPPAPTKDQELLSEIRDLLKK